MLRAHAYFGNNKVIGLHIRGTDKGNGKLAAEPDGDCKTTAILKFIDGYKHTNGSDQQKFLSQIRNRYQECVRSFDSQRACFAKPQMISGEMGTSLGEDVLNERLPSPRTNFLLECTPELRFAISVPKRRAVLEQGLRNWGAGPLIVPRVACYLLGHCAVGSQKVRYFRSPHLRPNSGLSRSSAFTLPPLKAAKSE
jgi:hypothetical protein